jgi:hypothetical protein
VAPLVDQVRAFFEAEGRWNETSRLAAVYLFGSVARGNREPRERRRRRDPAGTRSRPDVRGSSGFRNLLVHAYAEIDPAIVRDVLEHRLGDLEQLVAVVRARLPKGA